MRFLQPPWFPIRLVQKAREYCLPTPRRYRRIKPRALSSLWASKGSRRQLHLHRQELSALHVHRRSKETALARAGLRRPLFSKPHSRTVPCRRAQSEGGAVPLFSSRKSPGLPVPTLSRIPTGNFRDNGSSRQLFSKLAHGFLVGQQVGVLRKSVGDNDRVHSQVLHQSFHVTADGRDDGRPVKPLPIDSIKTEGVVSIPKEGCLAAQPVHP